MRKWHTKHPGSTETRKRPQSEGLEGQSRKLGGSGGEETPAFPQGVGSPTAGLNLQGLWNQFAESWQALLHELDRIQ